MDSVTHFFPKIYTFTYVTGMVQTLQVMMNLTILVLTLASIEHEWEDFVWKCVVG